MFLSPFLNALTSQWYYFINVSIGFQAATCDLTFFRPQTRSMVRTESIVTQLVFEHALRIRFKAETASEEPRLPSPLTPDSASVTSTTVVEGASTANGSSGSSGTPIGSAASSLPTVSKGKQKARTGKKTKTKTSAAKSKNGKDLIGKINNLVTADLDAILDGRDFLMIGTVCSSPFGDVVS